MTPFSVPLRDVYPNGSGSGTCEITLPPQTRIHARRWSRVASVFLGIGGLAAIASWEFLKSGDAGVIVDASLLLTLVFLPIGGVAYWIPRRLLRLPTVDADSVRWEAWTRERGFGRANPDVCEQVQRAWPWTMKAKTQSWPHLFCGKAGDIDIVVGSTRWTKSENGKDPRCAMVAATPTGDFYRWFGPCSMTRYLRGVDCVDLDVSGDRLRTESSLFDNTCNVRSDAETSRLHVLELFDPVTIDGLQSRYDIQWQSAYGYLWVVIDTCDPDRVNPAHLDTMCHGLAWLYTRLAIAAMGDTTMLTP